MLLIHFETLTFSTYSDHVVKAQQIHIEEMNNEEISDQF